MGYKIRSLFVIFSEVVEKNTFRLVGVIFFDDMMKRDAENIVFGNRKPKISAQICFEIFQRINLIISQPKRGIVFSNAQQVKSGTNGFINIRARLDGCSFFFFLIPPYWRRIILLSFTTVLLIRLCGERCSRGGWCPAKEELINGLWRLGSIQAGELDTGKGTRSFRHSWLAPFRARFCKRSWIASSTTSRLILRSFRMYANKSALSARMLAMRGWPCDP